MDEGEQIWTLASDCVPIKRLSDVNELPYKKADALAVLDGHLRGRTDCSDPRFILSSVFNFYHIFIVVTPAV